MKTLFITALAAMAMALTVGAQESSGGPPVGTSPVVEFKGVIKQVHISQGQGTPYLDVTQGNAVTKVYLGSMRYLIAENFAPKAGQEIVVKGYQSGDSVVAIQVSLPAEKKVLKLRDEKGWPLWRGGPMRGKRAPGK